jgi:hypothetical protein
MVQMASKTFLIALDLLDPALDLDGLNEFVKTSPLFDNWWNHIPGVFLVLSDTSADVISKAVRRYTKSARMLVIETNPEESEGWLSERGWKWIRRRSGQPTDQVAAQ